MTFNLCKVTSLSLDEKNKSYNICLQIYSFNRCMAITRNNYMIQNLKSLIGIEYHKKLSVTC